MLETEINPNDELWLSKVEAPQIISDPNLFSWDDEADLVVAGLGGAGIAAANEALDQQFSVIGIDKTNGGGSTAKSGGVFYAGGGTPIQHAAGVEDTPENMFNYLIPFIALAVFIAYKKLNKPKKKRRLSAPPSHQLPT